MIRAANLSGRQLPHCAAFALATILVSTTALAVQPDPGYVNYTRFTRAAFVPRLQIPAETDRSGLRAASSRIGEYLRRLRKDRASLLDARQIPTFILVNLQQSLQQFIFTDDALLGWQRDNDAAYHALRTGERSVARAGLMRVRDELTAAFQQLGMAYSSWQAVLQGQSLRKQRTRMIAANGLPAETLPEEEGIGQRVEQLAKEGKFHDALLASQRLKNVHQRTMTELRQIVLQRGPKNWVSVARTIPCPAPVVVSAAQDAKLDFERSTSAGPSACDVGERGHAEDLDRTVMLRVTVDSNGCATQAGVLVHSGYESFDADAVRWALSGAAYRPAYPAATSGSSEITFGVRCRVED